jgi:hypothetical protein
VNEDDMSNVDISKQKRREYLKDKINEIELNSKNKNIRDLYRGISEFKKDYQPKTNLKKNERGNFRLILNKF